jgi:hypothetical protein
MSTQVYAFGENGTPVGVLKGNYLWDAYGGCILACSDSNGGLHNGSDITGCANYFIVGDQVREGTKNGRPIFTIRGNGICDGCGGTPTFHCLNDNGDNRLALALTAISNVGELRFRPSGADVVDGRGYSGSTLKVSDENLDYSKLHGDVPDPWKNRHIQPDIAARFGERERSGSLYQNIQSSRVPPTNNSGSHGILDSLAGITDDNPDGLVDLRSSRREEPEVRVWSNSRSHYKPMITYEQFLIKYPKTETPKLSKELDSLYGIFILAMVTILPFVVGFCGGGIWGGIITLGIGLYLGKSGRYIK